jgi:hypothetical protein
VQSSPCAQIEMDTVRVKPRTLAAGVRIAGLLLVGSNLQGTLSFGTYVWRVLKQWASPSPFVTIEDVANISLF